MGCQLFPVMDGDLGIGSLFRARGIRPSTQQDGTSPQKFTLDRGSRTIGPKAQNHLIKKGLHQQNRSRLYILRLKEEQLRQLRDNNTEVQIFFFPLSNYLFLL